MWIPFAFDCQLSLTTHIEPCLGAAFVKKSYIEVFMHHMDKDEEFSALLKDYISTCLLAQKQDGVDVWK